MIIYEFRMNKCGLMTTIPDSHRIFGFLMNNSKKYYSNEEIGNYTNDILLKKQKCMVSNLMPVGYYPFPIEYVVEKHNIKKELYKNIKEFKFIKKKDLLNLLREKEIKKDSFNDIDFLEIKHQFIQKFRIESQMSKLPGLPNVAYSLDIITIEKNGVEQIDFHFFVKVEKDSLFQNVIDKMIEDIKNGSNIYYMGAKASAGLNTFVVKDIKKMENKIIVNKFTYINLGMMLPEFDKIKSENSYISLHISDRRPYNIENNVEKVIGFIRQGSIIVKKDEVKDEFELVKSIYNNYNLLYKNAIIFGNSYLEGIEV